MRGVFNYKYLKFKHEDIDELFDWKFRIKKYKLIKILF